jgi:hypothetical protein
MLDSIKKLFKTEVEKRRDETFDYEDNQEHFVGSHFDPFFENMEKDVMLNIPKYMKSSSVVKPYKNELIKDEPTDDPKWQKGYVLSYPNKESIDGIGSICGIVEEDENVQFISMFPWVDKGQVYSFSLEKVYVWDNGHEAQIKIDIGFTSVCFYDIHYPLNKKWYLQGNSYKFQILGIAYEAMYRKETEIEVDTSEELAKALDIEPGTMRKYTLTGMASFLCINSWDRDDYSFSGLITKVEEIYLEMTNEKAWVCSTSVLKEGGGDGIEYDIDILITPKVWKKDKAPKVGDDIEGSLCLQGKLNHVNSKLDDALEYFEKK